MSSAGTLPIKGAAAVTLGDATVSGGGHVDITAALGVTLDAAGIVATGGTPGAAISGTLAVTLVDASLSSRIVLDTGLDALPGYTITGRRRAFEITGRPRRFEVPRR